MVSGIEPSSGPNTRDVAVQIAGSGFRVSITSDVDEGTTTVDDALTVTIGQTPLAGVIRSDKGLIEGTVPAGLVEGTYDVTVTIGAHRDTLPDGYTVTRAGESALHLDPADGMPGGAPLTLTGDVTIDTTTLEITGASLPAGDAFDLRSQLGGGLDLAVLHVGALAVESGANVRVVGDHPLVIVAGGDVDIAGLLDAGARGPTPGAGGAAMGDGAGTAGTHGSDDSDSGGGGGGYGEAGASGGAISGCPVMGGVGGPAFGDAAIGRLVGGSGGASSSGTTCMPDPGGAGGGALQITSATQIAIAGTGRINAGGGGGAGGTDCGASDVNSAAGGGSGGAIALQAPAISNAGIIAANGGGGGGSSQTGAGSGMPGGDGVTSAMASAGGTGPRATGGSGGTGTAPPTIGGGAGCGANAAGGGGGVGRIAVSASFTSTGTVSPAPNTSLPP